MKVMQEVLSRLLMVRHKIGKGLAIGGRHKTYPVCEVRMASPIHIYRAGNWVTHMLAKKAVHLEENRIWMEEGPVDIIEAIVRNELLCMN